MGKKVTVVGAGFYGTTTAQRLAEFDVFETVVLTDIVDGKPAGVALDLNQSRPIEGFETKVVGVTTGPNGEDIVIPVCLPPGFERLEPFFGVRQIVTQPDGPHPERRDR